MRGLICACNNQPHLDIALLTRLAFDTPHCLAGKPSPTFAWINGKVKQHADVSTCLDPVFKPNYAYASAIAAVVYRHQFVSGRVNAVG